MGQTALGADQQERGQGHQAQNPPQARGDRHQAETGRQYDMRLALAGMLRVRTDDQHGTVCALHAQGGEQPAQQAGLHEQPGEKLLQHQLHIQPQREQHLPHERGVQQKQGQKAVPVAIRHGEQTRRRKAVQEHPRLIGGLHLGCQQLRQPLGHARAQRMRGHQHHQRER